VPPPDAVRRWPAQEPSEDVRHNDFAPYNLMFERGRLTGIIDLDLASPGPRARDMGYAAYRFAALSDPRSPDTPARPPADQRRWLAAFGAAYGNPDITPGEVVDAAIAKLRELPRSSSTPPPPGTPCSKRCSRAATS
jgi:aminoglycoside phosphotransferase (APT) family kinase protein